MVAKSVQTWTLEGTLEEISRLDRTMPDRSLAFILGAGASAASGIPTGAKLAETWLKELHQRECLDPSTHLEDWLAEGGHGIEGLVTQHGAAEFYPQVFEQRFRDDREAGYAALERIMEHKPPTLGYSMLAEILQKTRHQVVVTTNFDNLVSDALAMHGHKAPLIVAHESLTSFVRSRLRRPLIAKIHRDLFLHPKNDPAGVNALEEGWKIALRDLFRSYMPIVVGYGGNDGSLMGLLQSLDPREMAGQIVWCHPAGAPPSSRVNNLLATHGGISVEIPGFDEFMLKLAAKLVAGFDLAGISRATERVGSERTKRYRGQAEEMVRRLRWANKPGAAEVAGFVRDDDHWWTWVLRAQAKHELDAQEEVFEEGRKAHPKSAELHCKYAAFLKNAGRPDAKVEAMYKKALEFSSGDAEITADYARFLQSVGRKVDSKYMYEEALRLDPTNPSNITAYAIFLAQDCKDLDAAESMFVRARELAPDEVAPCYNYAFFLQKEREKYNRAEAMYMQALELARSDPYTVRAYAFFLQTIRKDSDAAEAVYKKAIEDNPQIATTMAAYAGFLEAIRKDYPTAEEYYRKAIALDPRDTNMVLAYVNFLRLSRHDADSAEKLYKQELSTDPRNVLMIGSYADFLYSERRDIAAAETRYRQALSLDPSNAGMTANLACVLLAKATPESIVESITQAERAVELSKPVPSQATAEALLYLSLAAERQRTELLWPLGRLKSVLQQGYERFRWDFKQVLDATFVRPDERRRALYEALGQAILHPESIKALDAMPEWVSIAPQDPFAAASGVPQNEHLTPDQPAADARRDVPPQT